MLKQLSIESPLSELLIQAKSNANISLAMGELPRSIGNGMTIDKSMAFVVTVNPIQEVTDLRFSAQLVNGSSEGHAATGECLECIEFEDDNWHLTIGTEDLASLDGRMPGLNILNDENQVSYSLSGISLELNNIEFNGEMTFHLIVSYKRLPDERECSAWFFADRQHDLVIKSVNS